MSIIEGKNYHDKTGPPDIPLADEYRDCNFSQVDCIDDDGYVLIQSSSDQSSSSFVGGCYMLYIPANAD